MKVGIDLFFSQETNMYNKQLGVFRFLHKIFIELTSIPRLEMGVRGKERSFQLLSLFSLFGVAHPIQHNREIIKFILDFLY